MICEVCNQNKAQYKCPACGMNTCSLQCVKQHKANTGCTGIKPRSEFIQVKDMDANMLVKDCALIDEATRSKLRADDRLPDFGKNTKRQKNLTKACADRGIVIQFMPRASTRSQENKTHIKNGKIFWTVLFRFYEKNHKFLYKEFCYDVKEDTPILDLITEIIKHTPNAHVSRLAIEDISALLVAEGVPGNSHFEILLGYGLDVNLATRTVVENPIIDVMEKKFTNEWNIVSQLTLAEELKPIDDKQETVEEDKIPDYDAIKNALKLDISKTLSENV